MSSTPASTRRNNNGLRKRCDCERRAWAKCAHPWYFNFKPRGGVAYRFSLDGEVGYRVKGKTEAEKIAADFRAAINAGTFVLAADRRRLATAAPHPHAGGVTLDVFATIYVEKHAKVSGKKTWSNDQHMLAQLCAFAPPDGSRLGLKALAAVTEDDLEAFHVQLRAIGRAASTRNHYVQVLKASFRWAAKKGYVSRSPISEDSSLKRTKIAQRTRRLVPDALNADGTVKTAGEERRLLAAASPRLQSLIVAALETCCRRGELLSLQWADVSLSRGELTIRAEKAKDAESRVLPVSARLRPVLEMARTDPAGNDYKPTAYVFGELGLPVCDPKRAWETALLKANGHDPVWNKTGLALTSRAALQVIDLHFHDLRHEGASRLLEAGWPIHHVQHMLGHASLDQTSTYLNATGVGLRASMRLSDEATRIRCTGVAHTTPAGGSTSRNDEATDTKQTTVK